jgi:hypothetical protein
MKRYQISYSFDARRKHSKISGFCDSLMSAVGNAVRHVGRSEFDPREYHAAIIIDRRSGKMIRKYHRNEHGSIVYTKLD